MRIKRKLRCHLTDTELKERAERLVEHLDNIDELTQQKKDAVKRFSDKIGGEESVAARLRAEIADGTELRDVECIEIPRDGLMVTIRMDTYAVLGQRPQSTAEKQDKLFEDRDQNELDELNRLSKILDLSDLLTKIERPVNTQSLATLDNDKLNELNEWAESYQTAAANETEKPFEPTWLEPLLQATQETKLSDKEMQIRVETIQNLLKAQSVDVTDEDVRSWTKAQQDQVMHWCDSLTAAEPLPRPEFLPKPKKDKPADQGDTGSSAASATSEPANATETAKTATEGETAANTGSQADRDDQVGSTFIEDVEAAANNGELILSRGDLFDMISQCGVEVRLETVEGWDSGQADLAYQWAKESLEAMNDGRERQPAPPFFFS